MAVRFLPPPEERAPTHRDEGENLAEVVEMRSWLRPARQEVDTKTALEEGRSAEGSPANDSQADDPPADDSQEGGFLDGGPREDGVPVSEHARVFSPEEGDPSRHLTRSHTSTSAQSVKQAQTKTKTKTKTKPVGAEADQLGEERGLVYDDAVRLLARRARSSGELRSDLLALDYPSEEVSIIIDEFEESHYLDDIGLARVQSEKLRGSKGASRGQIQRKLRDRKLPDAVIEEVIGELDSTEEYALLREAAEKRAERLTGLDRPTAQRRLLGFLARRGWSGEPAMRAANEALAGTGSGNRSIRASRSVRFE